MYEGLKVLLDEWKFYNEKKQEAVKANDSEMINTINKHLRYIAKSIQVMLAEVRSRKEEFEKIKEEDELILDNIFTYLIIEASKRR